MKPTLFVTALLTLSSATFALAADTGSTAQPAAPAADSTVKRHPLKGVITRVDAERSALMVKHEEIPGVMRAMTMAFKVDAATLKNSKEGQSITGLMSRQGANWVLEDVKVVPAAKN